MAGLGEAESWDYFINFSERRLLMADPGLVSEEAANGIDFGVGAWLHYGKLFRVSFILGIAFGINRWGYGTRHLLVSCALCHVVCFMCHMVCFMCHVPHISSCILRG